VLCDIVGMAVGVTVGGKCAEEVLSLVVGAREGIPPPQFGQFSHIL
jgi:hypothetical protein